MVGLFISRFHCPHERWHTCYVEFLSRTDRAGYTRDRADWSLKATVVPPATAHRVTTPGHFLSPRRSEGAHSPSLGEPSRYNAKVERSRKRPREVVWFSSDCSNAPTVSRVIPKGSENYEHMLTLESWTKRFCTIGVCKHDQRDLYPNIKFYVARSRSSKLRHDLYLPIDIISTQTNKMKRLSTQNVNYPWNYSRKWRFKPTRNSPLGLTSKFSHNIGNRIVQAAAIFAQKKASYSTEFLFQRDRVAIVLNNDSEAKSWRYLQPLLYGELKVYLATDRIERSQQSGKNYRMEQFIGGF